MQLDQRNINFVLLENFHQILERTAVYRAQMGLNVQAMINMILLTWLIVPLDRSVKVVKHKNVMQVDLWLRRMLLIQVIAVNVLLDITVLEVLLSFSPTFALSDISVRPEPIKKFRSTIAVLPVTNVLLVHLNRNHVMRVLIVDKIWRVRVRRALLEHTANVISTVEQIFC